MENTWTRDSNKERRDFYKKENSQITKDMEITIGIIMHNDGTI